MSKRWQRGNVGVRLIISLSVLLVAASVFFYRQDIIDRYHYYRYQPSETIEQIAARSGMNDRGRFYFYTSHPELNDRAAFNQNCHSLTEQTVVLGCYTTQRIYLFDIDDQRLEGIEEVTAAHEMLHAVYERLSESERERVDAMVSAQAEQIIDPRLQELIALYERTEPGARLNELHSILGTEVRTLSAELEEYYEQYFADRGAVVALAEQYEEVFADLRENQDQLVTRLNDLANQINTRSEAYNNAVAALNNDIAEFNQRAQAGSFSSDAEFQAERQALLDRQADLERERGAIDALASEYRNLERELAAVNTDAEELNQSINSNLTPVPSI